MSLLGPLGEVGELLSLWEKLHNSYIYQNQTQVNIIPEASRGICAHESVYVGSASFLTFTEHACGFADSNILSFSDFWVISRTRLHVQKSRQGTDRSSPEMRSGSGGAETRKSVQKTTAAESGMKHTTTWRGLCFFKALCQQVCLISRCLNESQVWHIVHI